VLDKFAKRRGRKDWKTYTKGAETLFFCERDIATLAYRAGIQQGKKELVDKMGKLSLFRHYDGSVSGDIRREIWRECLKWLKSELAKENKEGK
jgi:hypothetical protein